MFSNFGEALKHAALLGHGIALHPYYMVSAEIATGRLAIVLPDWEPEAYDITVIYSSRQNLPVRVRRFVEFLKEWAQTPPDWSVRGRTVRKKPAPRHAAQP